MAHTWDHFSPFATSTHWLLAVLAGGMDGKGNWSVSASRRGLTLKLNGLKVCHGRTCHDLMKNYEAIVVGLRTKK